MAMRLSRAELDASAALGSTTSSSSSSEDLASEQQPRSSSIGGAREDSRTPAVHDGISEGSLSVERAQMREELARVKATLSAIVAVSTNTADSSSGGGAGAPSDPAAVMPHAAAEQQQQGAEQQQHQLTRASSSITARSSVVPANALGGQLPSSAALERLLADVAVRLGSIERTYTDLSSKLSRVDHRCAESERTVRELQHISAGAIHETARLVDNIWGGTTAAATATGTAAPSARGSTHGVVHAGANPGGSGHPRLLPRTSSSSLRHLAPGPAAARPLVAASPHADPGAAAAAAGFHLAGGSQAVSGSGATLHQHASQIHKLIAGLDFLEQHIIRQDQAIVGVQKQVLALSHEQQQQQLAFPAALQLGELSVRLHDACELVGRLKSHVHKLDKKASGSEAAQHALHAHLEQVSLRVDLLEHARLTQHLTAASSPQKGGGASSGGAQQQEDVALLRSAYSGVSGSLQELTQQVQQLALNQLALQQQQQQQQQREQGVGAGLSAADGSLRDLVVQWVREELSAGAGPAAVPVPEERLAALDTARQQQERELQALRRDLDGLAQRKPQDATPAPALQQLQAQVEALSERLGSAVGDLGQRCAGADQAVAALGKQADQARLLAAEELAALEARLAAQVAALAAGLDAAQEAHGLLGQQLRGELRQVVAAQQQLAEDAPVPPQVAAELAELRGRLEEVGALAEARGEERAQELARLVQESHRSLEAVGAQVAELASQLDAQASQRLPALERSVQGAGASLEQLREELGGVRAAAAEAQARLGDLATRVQVGGLAEAVEELQGSCAEALAGLGHLKALVQREYISREALAAIFAAREEMRAAVSKLEQVFLPEQQQLLKSAEEGPSGSAAGAAHHHPPPPPQQQVDRLAGQVQQLEARVAELRAFAGEARPVVTGGVEDLRRSVQDLQLMLFDLRAAALHGGGHGGADTAALGTPTNGTQQQGGGSGRRSTSGALPAGLLLAPGLGPSRFGGHSSTFASASGAAGPGGELDAEEEVGAGTLREGPGAAAAWAGPGGAAAAGAAPRDYHGFAAPSGLPSPPATDLAAAAVVAHAPPHQQLEKRLTQVEMSLSGKLVALEAALVARGGAHPLAPHERQVAAAGAAAASPPPAGEVQALQRQLDALAAQVAALSTSAPLPPGGAGGPEAPHTLVLPFTLRCGDGEEDEEVRLQLTIVDSAPAAEATATASVAPPDELGALTSRVQALEGQSVAHSYQLLQLADWGAVVSTARVQVHYLVEDLKAHAADLGAARRATEQLDHRLAQVEQAGADEASERHQLVLTRLAAVETGVWRLSESYGALSRSVHALTHAHLTLEPGTPDAAEGAPAAASSLLHDASRTAGPSSLSAAARGGAGAGHALALAPAAPSSASAEVAGSSPPHDALHQQEQQQEAALSAVVAKVAELEELVSSCLQQSTSGPNAQNQGTVAARSSSGGGGGGGGGGERGPSSSGAAAVGDGGLDEFVEVLQAMRNRVLTLQGYVDSTQGMVKELHTVHGTVLLRLSALDPQPPQPPGEGAAEALAGPLGQVQADLASLEARFAAFTASQAQLSAALEGLRRVGDRLAQLDPRDGARAARLAALGQTMPAIAGQLKALERSLQARLDACCSQLAALGSVLAGITSDSKDPFAGAAVNAPAVKLLEAKVERVRGALASVARALAG